MVNMRLTVTLPDVPVGVNTTLSVSVADNVPSVSPDVIAHR